MKIKKAILYIRNKLKTELPVELSYHGLWHTLDVVEQTRRIALSEGVHDKEDLQLLETAAYFHDVGFTETYQNHEEKSCEIARNILPLFDYNSRQINVVCSIIMATKIPQTPLNHLSEILCDADLDYLGRDDFFTIGQKLYQELLQRNIVQNQDQWNQIQIDFLAKHHYFTETNKQFRNNHKLKNISAIK
jgi:HD superfamily phosphodiesterase